MVILSNILKNTPFFRSLTDVDRELLASLLRHKSIKKNEFLFRQGDEGTALYIILQGRIKISLSRRMDTVTLAILVHGEFLGEMALLDGLPRSADAMALEDSELYVLNRTDFLSFIVNNEKAIRAILHSFSVRLRKTDDQLAEMCFLNLSARLAKKLVEMAAIQYPDDKRPHACSLSISQHELGNLLGVSRESINKELRTFRDKGYVSTSHNSIIIHDIESLIKSMP